MCFTLQNSDDRGMMIDARISVRLDLKAKDDDEEVDDEHKNYDDHDPSPVQPQPNPALQKCRCLEYTTYNRQFLPERRPTVPIPGQLP
ncbi:hypothetical protein CGMCC3_g12239 [Colletotrichum fructicola]|nr:uncharacterized protein CGMCC3_g12239 [Colletotrichum fructicola]KAE9571618.1 hypothetical protein CGMCC3_g12239 [Colletotrichum fructicola]